MNIDKSKSNIIIKNIRKKKQTTRQHTDARRERERDLLSSANVIISIDNGVTGSLSAIIPYKKEYIIFYQETPVFECADYTKELQHINRIDFYELSNWCKKILNISSKIYKSKLKVILLLERPMVNPQRFKQSLVAIRAFETTLLVLESLHIDYIIIDSKQWQHFFFGKDTTQINLKKASLEKSLDIINKYNIYNGDEFDELQTPENLLNELKKHGDGDSLLMCSYWIENIKQKSKNATI